MNEGTSRKHYGAGQSRQRRKNNGHRLKQLCGQSPDLSCATAANRLPICNLEKIRMAGKKIRLIFGLAELSCKLKKLSYDLTLNTKILQLKFS